MMRYFGRASIVLLLSLVWGSSSLVAQKVAIQGKLDRSEIKTGEQAAIELKIQTDDLSRTKFYLKNQPSAGDPYTVIEFGALDTIDIDGKFKEINARLILTSFDSTLITIPPIVVETPSAQAETEPMALNVVQPEVDANHPGSFKDIKAPWEVNTSLWDWVQLILRHWLFWAIVAVGVLTYGLYLYFSRPKPAGLHLSDQEPVLSLWERTELRLKNLEHSGVIAQGLFKAYYSELVAIIKNYLDEAYDWDTAEMTTKQFQEMVRQGGFAVEQIQQLDDILRQADLSKFAKWTPSDIMAKEALLTTSRLLRDWHNNPIRANETPVMEGKEA